MDVGLIGLPRAGKTTLFNLLTGAGIDVKAYGRTETHRALAQVPDPRLDRLAELYHPRKVTPAQIAVVDVPGLSHTEIGGPNRFLNEVRLVDALVQVVRGFPSEFDGPPHPWADIEDMELELNLADLDLLQRRLERLRQGKKVPKEVQPELELLPRLVAALEAGRRLTQVALTEAEEKLLRGYQLLTLKPVIWVINLDEAGFRADRWPDQQRVGAEAEAKAIPVVTVAGDLEAEIQALDPAERRAFLADLGLEEPGVARVARAIYQRIGLISFLTAGEDEVRAWPIAQGTVAKKAAGKIHSDLERGFIRAEVVAFADLDRAGSMAAAQRQGWVRLEGRDYVVQDGDVITFRFNV
ncbi:MAG: redox-regulated ATPase YchF [Firmicutes bacterium]|nr:redox-regulated ATPase YchF [Alicyclobacillaceae bacterium]MCL6498030.1 redox-regulated ATPase YchF [Bacillota bacterium]